MCTFLVYVLLYYFVFAMCILSRLVPLWARAECKKALVCLFTTLGNKEFVLSCLHAYLELVLSFFFISFSVASCSNCVLFSDIAIVSHLHMQQMAQIMCLIKSLFSLVSAANDSDSVFDSSCAECPCLAAGQTIRSACPAQQQDEGRSSVYLLFQVVWCMNCSVWTTKCLWL